MDHYGPDTPPRYIVFLHLYLRSDVLSVFWVIIYSLYNEA